MRVLLSALITGSLAVAVVALQAGREARASDLTTYTLFFATIVPMVAVPAGAWLGALFSEKQVWPIPDLFSQISLAAMGSVLTAMSAYFFFCVTSFVLLQNAGDDPSFVDLVFSPSLHVPLEDLKRDISVGTVNRWLYVGMGALLGGYVALEISRNGWKRKSTPRTGWRKPKMIQIVETLNAPRDQPLPVWFEPWAAGLTFPSGTEVTLRTTSANDGRLNIKQQDEVVTVYGWSGCTLEVIVGCEVVQEFENAFPELPPGMEMDDFTTLLFGPPPAKAGFASEP